MLKQIKFAINFRDLNIYIYQCNILNSKVSEINIELVFASAIPTKSSDLSG